MANTKLAESYRNQKKMCNTTEIIKANFPVYQSLKNIRLANLNKFLSFVLTLTMIFSLGVYSFVVSKQKQIETIHYATKAINNENIELKARLDELTSFDNVNAKIVSNGYLQQPIKIIEVNNKISDMNVKVPQKSTEIGSMLGY